MTEKPMQRWRWIAAALLPIAAATLTPRPGDVAANDFWCWSCGEGATYVEFALNVLLFVPFGAALRVAGVRAPRALLVVAATTIAIEALQVFVVSGRDAAFRDCVANSVGGAVAFFLVSRLSMFWSDDRGAARSLAWGSAAVWIAGSAFTMYAFGPAMTANRLFAQITPRLGQYDAFTGQAGTATVNDAVVFSGRFPGGLTAMAWATEPVELAVVVKGGSATRQYAPILALVDGQRLEIATLGQHGSDLIFRSRTRGDAYGLNPVMAILPSVFGTDTAATVVFGKREASTFTAGIRPIAGRERDVSLSLRPAVGWMFLWPFGVPSAPTARVMTWLWLAVPFAVIGWWCALGWRVHPFALAPLLLAAIVAHVGVPLAFHADSLGGRADAALIAAGALCGLALGALRKSGSEP